MAKIWPVYEGKEPTRGGPWADMPLREAVALLELGQHDFVSGSERTPRFGDVNRDLSFMGFKHIVVEVGPDEARREGWRPGFYVSPLKPDEAFRRLLGQTFKTALGDDNVVRVESEPVFDSQGENALGITVIVTPEAVEKLRNGATLDALVLLQKRLRELREYRTPIVQYATEAELTEDAST